ncbi:MAG: hypothetical protein V2B17_00960 [Chloroflexota bacterium]
MPDPLDDVLRLVAEGRLSPEEAAPNIDALAAARGAADRARPAGEAARETAPGARDARPAAAPGPPRRLRVQVRDGGRTVVDLQLPGVLAELAGAVPGIPAAYADRVREALRTGLRGPIVNVIDEDGSGVTITID